MENKKLLSFLLAGALLGQNLPAQGINLDFIYLGGLVSAFYYGEKQGKNSAQAEKINALKSNNIPLHDLALNPNHVQYEAKLQSQLQDFLKTHHGIENVTFVPTEKGYSAHSNHNRIFIPLDDYAYFLEKIARNEECSLFKDYEKNKTIIEHVPFGSAEEIRMALAVGSLHHEAGHIKHQSDATNDVIDCLFPLTYGGLLTMAYPTRESFWNESLGGGIIEGLRNAVLAVCITKIASLAFGKYDETRADDTIPNDPRLLNAKKNYLMHAHFNEIHTWEEEGSSNTAALYKNCPELLHTLARDVHPSHSFRAQRFQNRLDAIAQQAARERANVATALKRYQDNNDNPLKNIKPSPAIMNFMRTAMKKDSIA